MEHEFFESIIPLIWFAGFALVGYGIFHKFSNVILARFKYTTTTKNYSGDKNIDEQLNNFINNAPRLLVEIKEEITKQRSSGVSDIQMKGLVQKESMLSFIVQNKEIIDILGKPILKKVIGFIKAI